MNLTAEEELLYKTMKFYADKKGYKLNTDTDILEKVIKGMQKIKESKGAYYCPCRLVTGNEEVDKKIICPCDYHEKEIEENGHCHCYLFFDK